MHQYAYLLCFQIGSHSGTVDPCAQVCQDPFLHNGNVPLRIVQAEGASGNLVVQELVLCPMTYSRGAFTHEELGRLGPLGLE